MSVIDRRSCLMTAVALAVAPSRGHAGEGQCMYDYLFLDLPFTPGRPAARTLATQLDAAPLKSAGGEVVGVFAPQLGWHARQAAVLLRWRAGASGRDQTLKALPARAEASAVVHEQLTPTIRPGAADVPVAGGVYVHRWFVVRTDAVQEFVAISAEGWRDFETRFDARIYGLFTTVQTPQDKAAGVKRLLLLTRYKDHGVWEASRDPTTDAMAAFARRQQLTRDSWAASTLLVRPAA